MLRVYFSAIHWTYVRSDYSRVKRFSNAMIKPSQEDSNLTCIENVSSPKSRVLLLHGMRHSSFTLSLQRNDVLTSVMRATGMCQSGELMQRKTSFLPSIFEKAISDSRCCALYHTNQQNFEFFYPTAPNRAPVATPTSTEKEDVEHEAWNWGHGDYATEVIKCDGFSLRYLLQIMREEGPFVGIVGFSTGALTAWILASLLERGASAEIMKHFQLDSTVSGH